MCSHKFLSPFSPSPCLKDVVFKILIASFHKLYKTAIICFCISIYQTYIPRNPLLTNTSAYIGAFLLMAVHGGGSLH